MTYINVVGDWENEYLTIWTGGANYGGTMDPGRFHIEVHGSPSPGYDVGPDRKYFDWRASEKHGIPIYRPLTSGARRNTVPTGYNFSKPISTIRGQMPVNSKSSGSSSEQNGTHVGPGGNTPGVYVPKSGHETRNGKIVDHVCKPGFHPRWHKHKNGDFSAVCVPNKFRRRKITFE